MYRNTLNHIKLSEKRKHYDELFQKIGRKSQLLWNVVNNLIRKTSNKMEITELNYNNRLLTDQGVIAESFNDHFVKAGERVKISIQHRQTNKTALNYVKRFEGNMLFSPVSEMYVCKLVKALKSKSSAGFDNISNVLLKQLVNVLKMPLAIVFNKSLSSGVFPDLMKIAQIIPLHKGGDGNCLITISLLPVISKILERIVFNALTDHLQKNNILYP